MEAAQRRVPADVPDRDLLRLVTCGSVDDGKSTLIGRLLHDTGSVADDVLEAARRDSARWGSTGGELDLSLLVDGLQAEREQGITIDVAYRYFATARRRFVLADAPGHEQYTRNMATGASGADLAILLVDASRGLRSQTRRHAYIVRMFGIERVVVAVNKMDRVGWNPEAFAALEREIRVALAPLGFASLEIVPLSAVTGDHVVHPSAAMPWHRGPTLLAVLEGIVLPRATDADFRLPVQFVNRGVVGSRGYSGTIAAGRLRVGDAVLASPSGVRATVRAIAAPDGERREATAGEPVVVSLDEEVDLSRGQVLAHPSAPPAVARRVVADLVWMGDAPLAAGLRCELKFAHRYVGASAVRIEHRIDVGAYVRADATALALNDLGRCEFALDEAVAVDSFEAHRATGTFLVIDLETHATIGAGLVRTAERGEGTSAPPVTRERRAAQKRQHPFVLWFTGLSGAGKSTLATALERELVAAGHHTYLLDGDRVREGLCRDLGFGELDRRENLRRVAELASTLADAGLIVLVACIAPYAADRARVRERLGDDYVEVFVDASVQECERRDPKGHYRRARAGELRGFTGVDAPYEAPRSPDLRVDTAAEDVDAAVRRVLGHLVSTGRLEARVRDPDWVI